jgi:hypothetical protein
MSLDTALDLGQPPTKLYGGLVRRIARRRWLTPVVVLLLAGARFAARRPAECSLIVSGHPGQALLTQIYGRPYVAASRGFHKGWFVWRVPHDTAASFRLDLSFQSI